ncbi:hypothetical protein BJX66DRAFT_48686 [Aspergillus keveii]|uniref:Uncharacterized protein n=1 Tax=Aspergillus keveii TaxID=714993 RepID=A0ABR4FRM2_9EURO
MCQRTFENRSKGKACRRLRIPLEANGLVSTVFEKKKGPASALRSQGPYGVTGSSYSRTRVGSQLIGRLVILWSSLFCEGVAFAFGLLVFGSRLCMWDWHSSLFLLPGPIDSAGSRNTSTTMDATDGVSLAAYDHRRRVSGKKKRSFR